MADGPGSVNIPRAIGPQSNERQAMRLFFSLSAFAFTMVLSLIAFTYTAIHFPTTMRDLLAGAQHVRDQISSLGLPDSYMVWVDIFLQPNQIVLIGFSIAMRLAIELIGAIFSGGTAAGATRTPVELVLVPLRLAFQPLGLGAARQHVLKRPSRRPPPGSSTRRPAAGILLNSGNFAMGRFSIGKHIPLNHLAVKFKQRGHKTQCASHGSCLL